MRIRNIGREQAKIQLQMAPMIDVVFQLLIFFMLSLRIVLPEGDFNITMPIQGSEGPADITSPVRHVRLRADPATGDLAMVILDDAANLGAGEAGIEQLNDEIRRAVYPGGQRSVLAPDMSVELDFDYELDYRWVVRAISAVRGEPDPQNPGHVIDYVENIRFAQSRPRQAG